MNSKSIMESVQVRVCVCACVCACARVCVGFLVAVGHVAMKVHGGGEF
jgi:hypothetical protein